MTHKHITKFDQWLWDNYGKITNDLTWLEYNEYDKLHRNETAGERWTAIIESMQKEESI
jgi:hypothetical protein